MLGYAAEGNYQTLLPDANFQRWNTLWNGYLDSNGKLENDGSKTVMLIRNRPGATEATQPTPPITDLRWGKDIVLDDELVTPVEDPQNPPPPYYDQYGNGAIDKGEPNNIDGNTIDMRGFQTVDDVSDDLEIVDEVSFEQDRGWEYDIDSRSVDVGSSSGGLPERKVHALDDPQGFNPDCLTRVDYRTKGDGWAPVSGATGEMLNGNNWQDTATEQWIRGEGVVGSGGQGGSPQMFYDNSANTNPDAIQPYVTNVPLWLDDSTAPDYDFTASYSYQVMAGRINPLAVAYIPGDCDRDGDADGDDIAKTAAVFGDDDWIFSNSFATAPEGKDGDPATQTRPWDVDQTGDNGIEASDLQWTLNFQGDATGQVVGRTYDSTTPATTGVYLNSNAGVACTVVVTADAGGTPLDEIAIGQSVFVTVSAQVTAGANSTTGQQNGVMQFVQDVAIDTAGVFAVVGVTAEGSYATTRAALQTPVGTNGDLGIATVNGYTTSFTEGLSGASALFTVELIAVGAGSVNVSATPAAEAKFAASSPHGLKVGHTDNNGNPASSNYAGATLALSANYSFGDLNCSGAVDNFDIDAFVLALTSAPDFTAYYAVYPDCDATLADVNEDGSVNNFDIDPFVDLLTS